MTIKYYSNGPDDQDAEILSVEEEYDITEKKDEDNIY